MLRWHALGLVAALVASGGAAAATINVTSFSGGTNDGTGCTLRDAIEAVNLRLAIGQCPAGSGPVDTISIAVDSVVFSERDAHSTNAALPALAGNRFLNLYGKPGTRTLLDRGGCLLNYLDGITAASEFRLLEVQSGAAIYVADVDFSHGCADGPADPVNDTSSDNARGGAIVNNGSLYLLRSRFSSNVAKGWGGAIYNGPDSQLTATDVDFESNSCAGGGGAVFIDTQNDPYDAEFSASLFNGNRAFAGQYYTALGGAIRSLGTLVVTNSTFTENFGDGGSLFSAGYLGMSFTTLQNSQTPTWTLGIGANSTAYVKSSLFGPTPYPIYVNCGVGPGASVFWSGVSISIDDSCGGGANLSNTSPDLDANLATNGGPTPTLRLMPGSPATEADSDCTDVYGDPVTTDQRGFPRPSAHCDAGAFDGERIFANGFN